MLDWVFAFLHLGALLAVLGYALVSLVRGNIVRGALIVILLAVYYHFVLHPGVVKEIGRRRKAKRG